MTDAFNFETVQPITLESLNSQGTNNNLQRLQELDQQALRPDAAFQTPNVGGNLGGVQSGFTQIANALAAGGQRREAAEEAQQIRDTQTNTSNAVRQLYSFAQGENFSQEELDARVKTILADSSGNIDQATIDNIYTQAGVINQQSTINRQRMQGARDQQAGAQYVAGIEIDPSSNYQTQYDAGIDQIQNDDSLSAGAKLVAIQQLDSRFGSFIELDKSQASIEADKALTAYRKAQTSNVGKTSPQGYQSVVVQDQSGEDVALTFNRDTGEYTTADGNPWTAAGSAASNQGQTIGDDGFPTNWNKTKKTAANSAAETRQGIRTMTQSLSQVSVGDIENAAGIESNLWSISPDTRASEALFSQIGGQGFLDNISAFEGKGALSDAEGAAIRAAYNGIFNETGLKPGLSEEYVYDQIQIIQRNLGRSEARAKYMEENGISQLSTGIRQQLDERYDSNNPIRTWEQAQTGEQPDAVESIQQQMSAPQTQTTAPAGALQYLQQNPDAIEAFEQKYGYRPEGF